ncbi:hypothetical protein EBT16_01820 [bacterium]|nr:hypothetical protein [bacterium]
MAATAQMIVQELYKDLAFKKQLQDVLPTSIPVEKFLSATLASMLDFSQEHLDVIMSNRITRNSLHRALLRCGQDGMMPDGKEAYMSLIKKNFGTSDKKDYQPVVQIITMVQGLIKAIYNSGKVVAINTNVVHEKDDFDYDLGIQGKLTHRMAKGNRGPMVMAYAEAKMTDGSIMREVMTSEDVQTIKSKSKSKDFGPWKDFEGEMWRKSALRRLYKSLPKSADPNLSRIIESDDEDYDFDIKQVVETKPQPVPTHLVESQEESDMPSGLAQIADGGPF